MPAILQATFPMDFLFSNRFDFIKISLKVVAKRHNDNKLAMISVMARHRISDKPLYVLMY